MSNVEVIDEMEIKDEKLANREDQKPFEIRNGSVVIAKSRLKADGADKIFSLIYFLVGYLLVYTFSSAKFERNLAAFTVIYAVVVLAYCWKKKLQVSKESYFWLAVMLAIGIPYAFWSVFPFLQILALIVVAAYWTISIFGRLLMDGKTSQLLFFDGLNAMFAIPFANFDCQFRVLFQKKVSEEGGEKKENYLLSVLIGAAIAFPALLVILPLLSRADAGFEQMIGDVLIYIRDHFLFTIVRIIFTVPVACYLYGLLFGSVSGRNTDSMNKTSLLEAAKNMRMIPDMAVGTAMMVICAVYVIFIALQGNYLFSAFTGNLPVEFTYAEYARRGFFELCKIGAFNMFILWCLGLLTKNGRAQNKIFRVMSVCLSVLTLLIIATAMSKMGMYIVAYGLTVKRILTMVFMIWMVIVFVCVILLQKKEIPLARICILTGAAFFALLCICPIEDWIVLYNGIYFPK